MKKLVFFVIILVVILIGFLHFFTPGYMVLYHDTYRRLSYFPIVLGAIWFGVKGGLFFAVLSSIAFIPHLLLYVGQGPEMYIGEFMEVALYLAAGTVTGIIAGKEARLRERYQSVAEKLEKSYERLHQETELLLEAEEQLSSSQRLSALGQLSASLAHEIKNPISSIRGSAQIFLDEFPQGHPKREFVEILIKETDRLNATVEEVLQYSRGQQQQVEKVESEPLGEVLDNVAKLLDTQLRDKKIELVIKGQDKAAAFQVAGAKMSQVLLNIILNSIDALATGGRIEVDCNSSDQGLVVSVSDNGPGIGQDIEDVFAPFVSGREDGTGLGLSISKKIVESYGGAIQCSNRKQGGACFTITIPSQKTYPEEKV